jgi:hypothetical protein
MADRTVVRLARRGAVEVQRDGQIINRHATQAAAISGAKAVVRGLPAGQCSQIVVQRPDETIRTEWTYGKDPHPPVG